MSFVVLQPCHGVCAGECIKYCPVSCIYEPRPTSQHKIFVIDPEVCIDCGACVTPCPVDAIKSDLDITDKSQKYIEINRLEAKNRR